MAASNTTSSRTWSNTSHLTLVAPRVGPHDQLQHPARSLPKVRPDRVLVIAAEPPHYLLDVETQVICLFIYGKVLGPCHNADRKKIFRPGANAPGQMIQRQITQ